MGVACDVFLDSSTIFVFLRSEYQYSSPKLIKSYYNPDYHWSSRVCFQNALGYVRTIRLNPRPNNPSIGASRPLMPSYIVKANPSRTIINPLNVAARTIYAPNLNFNLLIISRILKVIFVPRLCETTYS